MKQRGFTIIEVAISMLIAAAGALLVTEALSGAEGAAQADQAKSKAVRAGDDLLRRMGLELSQSSTLIDNDLPSGEDQRLWIVSNGVRFQKVIGYEIDGTGSVTQEWSPRISYLWDEDSGVVTRSEDGATPLVVARGITGFDVTKNDTGQVFVTLTTKAGSEGRGTETVHQRSFHVTARNGLK